MKVYKPGIHFETFNIIHIGFLFIGFSEHEICVPEKQRNLLVHFWGFNEASVQKSESAREKTNNLGLQPGLTLTSLHSHRSRVEA